MFHSVAAVDRTLTSSLTDAREAIVNAAIDTLSAYGAAMSASQRGSTLVLSKPLRLLPLYFLALLKSVSSRAQYCKSVLYSQFLYLVACFCEVHVARFTNLCDIEFAKSSENKNLPSKIAFYIS